MSFITNFVGFTKKVDLPRLGDSDSYNMFVDTLDANDHSFNRILRPFPGYEKVFPNDTMLTGTPQGLYKVSKGYDGKPAIYAIFDGNVFLITNAGPVKVGSVASREQCTFAETTGYGNGHPHLVICDGIGIYAVGTDYEPSQQAADFKRISKMPLKYGTEETSQTYVVPGWIAYMYGYLIMGEKDSDVFYYSYQYPFERTTNPLDLFDTDETGGYGHWVMSEFCPDNTLIGCSINSRLYTFGTRTLQAFTFSGNSTMPFYSPDTAAKNIGIRNKHSMAEGFGSIFWLYEGSVYCLQGDNPIRISTDEIEEQIAKCNQDSIEAWCFKYRSHEFYVLNFIASGKTFVYDITEQGWTRIGSRTKYGTEGCFKYRNSVIANNGKIYLQTKGIPYYESGANKMKGGLVQITESKWFEDDNTPILRKRTGNILTSDHKNFKVAKVTLFSNTGDYKLMLDKIPYCNFRYSKDGVTWSIPESLPLGKVGTYDYNVQAKKLGKANAFTIEFATSEPIPFAIYGLKIDGTPCF